MRLFILNLMFVASCFFASAQQYSIKDDDKVMSKKEFTALEQVIAYQIQFYNRVLPNDTIKAKDVKLKIFSNYAEYLTFQKETSESLNPKSMGFYSHKEREAVVCKDKIPDKFLEVCYHELSHFFVNTYFGNIPVWINEGLAVYFEHTKTGKRPKHIPSSRMINRVKTMIDLNDINLTDFITWNRNQFYKKSFSHDSYGYALGYSIIYFLMQKDKETVINLIRNITEGASSHDALNKLYDGGFSNFEKDFFLFISKK